MFSQVSEVAIICGSTECQYLKGTCLKKDAIIVNGKCSGFEPKTREIEKCTLSMFNPASMKDRYLTEKLDEIIDAVNELRREREGK